MKESQSPGIYPVAIEDLIERQGVLNLSGLARAAGMKPGTLRKYVSNATALSPQQSLALGRAMRTVGIVLVDMPE